MPKYLLGKGDFFRSYEEYPYAKHAPGLKNYLLVTSGYHIGGLITHFFKTWQNDFLEMALHHIVALFLFGGCYMTNCWEGGAVVAYLHDLADITTNLSRLLSETNIPNITAVIFIIHMGIWLAFWFYTSLILHTTCDIANPNVHNLHGMP